MVIRKSVSYVARILFLLSLPVCWSRPKSDDSSSVLLISLHGARSSYLTDEYYASIARIGRESVQVPRLKPEYLTESLPNQVSLLTGRSPEQHGFVANSFFDPDLNARFDLSTAHEKKWWSEDVSVPVWTRLERLGYRSTVYDFVEGNADLSETALVTYESLADVPLAERAERVVEQFRSPADERGTRPKFVALFIQETAAEQHGPHTEQTAASVRAVDGFVASIVHKLADHNVNIIITGDHGIADVPSGNVIFLEELLDPADYRSELLPESPSPMMAIWPVDGKEAAVFLNLTERRLSHLKVYLKQDIPSHLRYKHNHRIAPIILQANEGWLIARSHHDLQQRLGSGGYDNTLPSMQTFAVVTGPLVARNKTIPSLDLTDIYCLITHFLGVPELISNASKAVGEQFVHRPCSSKSTGSTMCLNGIDLEEGSKHSSKIGGWPAFLLVVTLGLVTIGIVYTTKRYKRKTPRGMGYKRVRQSLEPDLSLRTEPLLDSSNYKMEDSIQLSVLSDVRRNGHEEDDDDDDSPPGTFTI